MNTIDQVLENLEGCGVDKRYFNRDHRFSKNPDDYGFRGLNATQPGFQKPEKVIFLEDHTSYGIVLRGPTKGKIVDAAVLGFRSEGDFSDCLEIHGGNGRFGVLTPVDWSGALLNMLIGISKKAEMSAVYVLPAIKVDGMDGGNYERLRKRYDTNAELHGFRFSKDLERYVLEL